MVLLSGGHLTVHDLHLTLTSRALISLSLVVWCSSTSALLQASENSTNLWTAQFEIGQFSGVDNNEYIGGVSWTPESNLDNMTWTAEQFAAGLGSLCSPGLGIQATINYTRHTWTWDDSLPSKEKLVGMNATLGIPNLKWEESQGLSIGQMTQVSAVSMHFRTLIIMNDIKLRPNQ
jgi:hypothetical protein